jgi:hypothetical protein
MPRTAVYSKLYDDMPNCHFMMCVEKWGEGFRVHYFNTGDFDEFVYAVVANVEELEVLVKSVAHGRFYMHMFELWPEQLALIGVDPATASVQKRVKALVDRIE